jgi:uncharacterized membrane protein YkvA (DUF1232 family)
MAHESPKSLIPDPKDNSSTKGLMNQVKLILRLMGDDRINPWLKVLPIFSILYMISPLDMAIPILDDAVVLGLGLYTFVELCPDDIVAEHRAALNAGSAKKGNFVDGNGDVKS